MFAVLTGQDYAIIFAVVLLAASLASVCLKPRELMRLMRLERKLDLLLKNAGIHYDPAADVPEEVLNALRQGRKIEAIKLYRQATGAGLAEAKVFVEELQARQP